jgi:gluconate kinase
MDTLHPPIIWLFGKPSVGKSAIGGRLVRQLRGSGGRNAFLLDGDQFRNALGSSLRLGQKVAETDREENIIRAINMACLLSQGGILPVCAFVTPTKRLRNIIKERLVFEVPIYFVHLYADAATLFDRRQTRGSAALAAWLAEADEVFEVDEDEFVPYIEFNTGVGDTVSQTAYNLRRVLACCHPSLLKDLSNPDRTG